jgi:hypothetical protein
MTREIERRLRDLRTELRGLSRRERRRVLAEARDHLLSSLEDGCDEHQAVDQLGAAEAFAGFPQRRRHGVRGVAVGVPLLLSGLALAPSLDKAVWRFDPALPLPTQAQAANPGYPPKDASIRRCVAAWNAPANARFQALAERDRVRRANVFPLYAGKVTRTRNGHLHLGPVHFAACGVNLWLAPTASPYQRYVQIQAKVDARGIAYSHVYHGRARTAARTANSRVLAGGRLAYAGHQLGREAACGRGPVGTAVVGVEALPAGVRLSPGGVTAIPATPRPRFAVTVRNVGRVAIHGAVLSLEAGGPARPRRPWFRTKPAVLPLLPGGRTVRLVFATRPLGHGPRFVRANTAAVGCETRVTDNTHVFQVTLR